MNVERMQLKCKLADDKNKLRDLDIKASGLITLVRTYLNPYEDDVTKLETDKALQAMKDLASSVAEMKDLKAKVEKMERDLE